MTLPSHIPKNDRPLIFTLVNARVHSSGKHKLKSIVEEY